MIRFNPVRVERRRWAAVVAASVAAMLLGGLEARAQFGPLTDGSLDPTNKNNNLPGYITIPGTGRPPESSKLGVEEPSRLNADGNFIESGYGPNRNKGRLGELLRDAKSSKAFWQYIDGSGNKYTEWAAPRWQAVLDAKERDLAESFQLRAAQAQVQARQQLQWQEMARRQEAARQQAARQQVAVGQYLQGQLQQLQSTLNQQQKYQGRSPWK